MHTYGLKAFKSMSILFSTFLFKCQKPMYGLNYHVWYTKEIPMKLNVRKGNGWRRWGVPFHFEIILYCEISC